MPSTLTLDIQEAVATLTLTGATMPPSFFPELRESFRGIAKDSRVRAVVVRSSAKGFSYGLDLPAAFKEMGAHFAGGGANERSELLAIIADWQDCMSSVVRCAVPVIAAVHGPCLGGGVDLITCADVRLASQDALFSVRETRIAIVADLGTLQRLPALVGQGHARELALTGCDIDANRAAEIGLVNHVHNDREAVHQAAQAMAKSIADNPPLTVRGVKNVLDFGRDHGGQAGLQYVGAWNAAFLASEDLGEAMQAFMAKRPPDFKGK